MIEIRAIIWPSLLQWPAARGTRLRTGLRDKAYLHLILLATNLSGKYGCDSRGTVTVTVATPPSVRYRC